MSKVSKQERLQRQNQLMTQILFIPIIILLAMVPLIVRMKFWELPPATANTLGNTVAADFFSYYKAMAVLIMTIIMIGILFFAFEKKTLKKGLDMKIYLWCAGIFALFIIASAIFSKYKPDVLLGGPDTAEGVFILLSYVFIMLYTSYTFRKIRDYRYIFLGLGILVGVTTILGVFQYAGKDVLLHTDLGIQFVVPKQYMEYKDSIGTAYESGKIYGTMFHYNYMGSFAAMVVPLFTTLAICVYRKKEKIVFAILALCSLFLLFGSTSRGGLIGVGLAAFVGIITLGKQIGKMRKQIGIGIVVLAIVVTGLNVVTGGTIFERIPSLVKDITGFTKDQATSGDYKDTLPLREMKSENGKVSFTTQTDTLVMELKNNELVFTDKEGKTVLYQNNNNIYSTEDERFNGIQFKQLEAAKEAVGVQGLLLNVNNMDIVPLIAQQDEGISFINKNTQEKMEIVEAPSIGFKGKEKLGSARGYIWSRSIPMLKDTLLLGYGPDTYAIAFPQNDLLAKWYAYDTPNMIVSKPHNLYLQIAINNGVVALLAFLGLVGTYIFYSLKLFAFKVEYEHRDFLGIATFLAIVGYLGAGIFNDSLISVAPIFWILLGVGMALNHIIAKERMD